MVASLQLIGGTIFSMIQSVAICDSFNPYWPKFLWVAQGFEQLGLTMRKLTTEESLRKYLAEPDHAQDLLLFSQRPPVDPGELELLHAAYSLRTTWACWVFDLLGGDVDSPGQLLLDCMPWHVFDHIFCKNPEVFDMRLDVHWLDQACPPWECVEAQRPFDVLFAGTCTPEREAIVAACSKAGFITAVAGLGWKARVGYHRLGLYNTNSMMQQLFGMAKISIGGNRPNGDRKSVV